MKDYQDFVRLQTCVVIFALFAQAPRTLADAAGNQSFFTTHCVHCHGDSEQNAQIRLDKIDDRMTPQAWAKIYEAVARGDMPPADEPQPTSLEKERFLKAIEDNRSSNLARQRRLNRRELSAALQELTGLPIDFGVALPADARIDGFDTGAAALSDSADSTSQWLEVSRRATESIRFLDPDTDAKLRIDFREHSFNDFRKFLQKTLKLNDITTKSKRLVSKEDVGLFLQTQWSGDRGSSFLSLPARSDKNAAIKVAFRAKAIRPLPGLPAPMLWVKIGGKYIDYVSLDESPRTLTYHVRMEDHVIEDNTIKVMLRSVVEMPFAVEGFANDDRSKPDKTPGGIGIYRPKFDRKKLRTPDVQPVPSIVLEWIEVDYDHKATWPHGGELQDIVDDDTSAKRLLSLWMDRAWRRPTTDDEQGRFFDLYESLRKQGHSFDDALRASFRSVLMGGSFRYLESPAASIAEQVEYAVASRLSFTLAGSPPDSELRTLASKHKLRDPAVLNQQVDRLLASESSDQFFRPFVMQWLSLEQPITLTMSHFEKQDFRFGRHLKASMKEETIQYVAKLFQDNRPAKELIASDWTMMNDVLAWHYNHERLDGGKMRNVRIDSHPKDGRGGGILGHAGIQSMLCWMGDNWTIYRGAWLLNHVLDDPLPPAPLEVPELIPSDKANQGKTIRELLAQHQQDPNCAVCHRKMDPLGFAFQNFDLSGRWRNVEFDQYHRYELDGKIEWRGKGESRPVDATGRLPRGESFSSYAEFKEILVTTYIDDIVRGLLKKLTLYGTGRQPNVRDLVTIQSIMKDHAPKGYLMKDVLKALVRSRIFLGDQQSR